MKKLSLTIFDADCDVSLSLRSYAHHLQFDKVNRITPIRKTKAQKEKVIESFHEKEMTRRSISAYISSGFTRFISQLAILFTQK